MANPAPSPADRMATDAPPVVPGPSWLKSLGRTPLLMKLVMLDAAINIASFVTLYNVDPAWIPRVAVSTLIAVLVLNAGFVVWTLGPMRSLEETAVRVTQGELHARAEVGWADRNVSRIAFAFNRLLDQVEAKQARVRYLASQVVAAGDLERAHIARELHDGAAQSLSALQMLVASTLKHELPVEGRERLELVHEIATEVLAEIRSLSHAMHPRSLDELGLASALDGLVRRAQPGTDTTIALEVDLPASLPSAVAGALYRVAQEALHNALQHAGATQVHLRAGAAEGLAWVEVQDDGRGFDPSVTAKRGLGLFMMEERVGLVEGRFSLQAAPGRGVRIGAQIPIPAASPEVAA